VVKPEIPSVEVTSHEPSKTVKTPRRTYSITNDVEIEVKDTPRLPRIGWQNHRQHFVLSEEGDVPLKEQSPVRLPRVGQAPRREFSFSNLSEAYKSQETHKPKEPTHVEVDDEEPAPVEHSQTRNPHYNVFESEDTPKSKPVVPVRNVQHETIFHDADPTPQEPLKPSIGGGTGGRRPEETIFVELEEDSNPFVQPKKTPIKRRDQTHFSFTEESPATPIPRNKQLSLQHFIEGTPDPHESEYRQRALQRKEVNHFRPDTVPHFEFVDQSDHEEDQPKRENTEGMNQLLKGIGRNWNMGSESPTVAKEGGQGRGLSKKGLPPHFSFGTNSPEKREEEKENGRTTQSQTKRYCPQPTPFWA
jgi:hypothetical protein